MSTKRQKPARQDKPTDTAAALRAAVKSQDEAAAAAMRAAVAHLRAAQQLEAVARVHLIKQRRIIA